MKKDKLPAPPRLRAAARAHQRVPQACLELFLAPFDPVDKPSGSYTPGQVSVPSYAL